ncbi:MAG: hypothetical protein AAGA48_03190 [Myxococcota bacterium]
MGENNGGSPPSQAELQQWVDRFGLTHPVVADPGFGVGGSFVPGGSIGLPSLSLLGPGAEVLIADGRPNSGDVISALP